jgi:hypothetical protein
MSHAMNSNCSSDLARKMRHRQVKIARFNKEISLQFDVDMGRAAFLADAAGSFGFDALGVQASRVAARVQALLAQGQRHRHDVDEIGLALAALQA